MSEFEDQVRCLLEQIDSPEDQLKMLQDLKSLTVMKYDQGLSKIRRKQEHINNIHSVLLDSIDGVIPESIKNIVLSSNPKETLIEILLE